jgi:hypothetical protein
VGLRSGAVGRRVRGRGRGGRAEGHFCIF